MARIRQRRRNRIVGVLVGGLAILLGAGAAVVLVGLRGRGDQPSGGRTVAAAIAGASGSAPASPSASTTASPSTLAAPVPANVPDKGAGTFAFADGTGPVLGKAGNLRRYRVAVENGASLNAGTFASAVDAILGGPDGWTAAGTVRFQRVPQKSAFEVTIYLATPATTDQLCASGGLHVQKFLSCRLAGQIVINLARWVAAVPDYGAPLETYQQYALNHEIGRDLGYPNEMCPGPGNPAPVMQQQSLGLDGCTANAWPYRNGTFYRGRPIP